MKPTLTLTQTQQMTMTPQLQQAIRLLQLSNQGLDLEIKTQLDKNPFLELEHDPSPDNPKYSNSHHFDKNFDHFDYSSGDKAIDGYSQDYHEWLFNRETENTLQQHLLWQLNMGSFSDSEHLVATQLIDAIDEEGYLACSLEEIQESFIQQYPEHEALTLNDIESVLQAIQHFDPIGIAARHFLECLSIQLNALPKETPFIQETVQALNFLDLVGKRDYAKLKKRLKTNEEGINTVIKTLKNLNPKPGKNWSRKKTDYIVPDLIVMKKNNRFVVELNMKTLPKVRLNPEYVSFMNRVGTDHSSLLLKEHFNEAKHFLKSIQHRQVTLLMVAEYIVEFQQSFFEFGAEKLRPMILQEVSRDCGIHESTVSRITTQKYLDTPKGLIELKYFFSSVAYENQTSPEQSYSTKAIQAMVKKIISLESPKNTFTDDTIMKMLALEGIQVSRRAVTKYREKMKIPTSHQRRSFNMFNDIAK